MLNRSSKTGLFMAAAIIVALMQGCAGQSVKLDKQSRAELGKLDSIKVVHQRAGWPSLQTPAGVLASNLTFGMSEDWSAGQKLVEKYKIQDPGQLVKKNFLEQVNKGARVANFISDEEPLSYDDSDIEKLKEKYGTGAVLKFSTPIWQIWYYPFNWARYQMWYGASAELVSLDSATVLWSANCRADQDNSETAPTLDELTADSSTVLKTWVQDATAMCTKKLLTDFLQ